MAPRNMGNRRFDARQLLMQKKQNYIQNTNSRNQGLRSNRNLNNQGLRVKRNPNNQGIILNKNFNQQGLRLNTNLRNILKAKRAGGKNGIQGRINLVNRGPQSQRSANGGNLNNKRFKMTNKGIIRNTIVFNRQQNQALAVKNPNKNVKLIGSKLVVIKKQGGAAVKMGRNGIPQRIVPNIASSNMEEEDDSEAFTNFRKAQMLKQHLMQSFQERLSQPPALSTVPSPFSMPVAAPEISSTPKPKSCCSLLVTNLHPSVTEEDVVELFSDVGLIRYAKLDRPGTAAVVYHNAADALKAKDIYHNRHLDGIPMSCEFFPQYYEPSETKKGIASRLGGKVVTSTPMPVSPARSTIFGNRQSLLSTSSIFGNQQSLPSTSGIFGNKALKQPTNQDNVVFTVKLQ